MASSVVIALRFLIFLSYIVHPLFMTPPPPPPPILLIIFLREATESSFLVAQPLRGGGDKGLATKKTNIMEALKKITKNLTTKLEGGGGLRP